MKRCIPISIFLLIGLIFSGCGSTEDSLSSDKKILTELVALSHETQDFFDSNTKVQCACLAEHKNILEKMLSETQSLAKDLKAKKVSIKDEAVATKIETIIYPVLGKYNDCNADAPQPSPETFQKIENDLKTFSGASAPGGASDHKMRNLSNALMRKYCKELHNIGVSLNDLTTVISPGYGQ